MTTAPITKDSVESAYKAMIGQKTHRDIAFHGGLVHEMGMCLFNKEDLATTKQKLIPLGWTYNPINSIKKKVVIDGIPTRQFHLLVLQSSEMNIDTMGLLLFGFMVSGCIIAFDTKKDRDKFQSGFTISE